MPLLLHPSSPSPPAISPPLVSPPAGDLPPLSLRRSWCANGWSLPLSLRLCARRVTAPLFYTDHGSNHWALSARPKYEPTKRIGGYRLLRAQLAHESRYFSFSQYEPRRSGRKKKTQTLLRALLPPPPSEVLPAPPGR